MTVEVSFISCYQYIGSTCTVETGWLWENGTTSSADTCEPICGDGLHVISEQCDDGNIVNSDGCSDVCTIETGYEWSGGSM